eukprot:gene6467-7201_t
MDCLRSGLRKKGVKKQRLLVSSELDDALSNTVELFEENDREHERGAEEKKKKLEEDVGKAEEMRKQGMERFSETKARSGEKCKRKRPSGSETLSFI